MNNRTEDSKRYRVLALIPDRGFGGAERVFNTLNNGLLDYFDLYECYFNLDAEAIYETRCEVVDLGVGREDTSSKITRFIRRIVRFRRLVREIEPDVIISHLEGADYVSMLTPTKAKKITIVHGSKRADQKISGIKGLIRRRIVTPALYALADKIVAVSRALRDEMRDYTYFDDQKITSIYNSVDQERIVKLSEMPLETQHEHIFEKRTLITSSRLDDHYKNLRTMIDIYSMLPDKSERRLVIVGDGPDREMLIEHAQQKSLTVASVWDGTIESTEADIYFMGYQNNPFKFIKRSDIFLLTSYSEGFPLGPIEAMACRRVVISSNCPTGPSEILKGEEIKTHLEIEKSSYAGVLMPIPRADDRESLELWVKSIEELLGNDHLRRELVEKSTERIEELSVPKIIDQWRELIEELLAK